MNNEKHELYQFGDERVRMPRPIAIRIEKELVKARTNSKMKLCYDVIRRNNPKYKHLDDSNARKMLTARNIDGVIRKLPVTAILEIVDILGIASGKYMMGSQPEIFGEVSMIIKKQVLEKKENKKPAKRENTSPKLKKRKQLDLFKMTTTQNLICPNCTVKFTEKFPMKNPQEPTAGSILVCDSCGNINKVTENNTFEDVTENEMNEIKLDDEESYYLLLETSHFFANMPHENR